MTFIASDGTLADTEFVAITVTNVDRAPVLATIGAHGVNEGANLNFIASATDPDGQTPVMTAENLPTNATYTDHGDGTATLDFNPDFTQANVYNVRFIASEGLLADSETVTITVADAGNQPPVLAAIGSRSIDEGATLTFSTSATDLDGTIPAMTAVNVPTNATYTDYGNGTATFSFSPDFTQAGIFHVTFIASDGVLADSEVVAITVTNVNRAPILASIGPRSVNAGSSLTFNASATDADSQIPVMTAINLPAHATYIDLVNGTGTFVFVPDMIQSGIYNVTFIASDGSLADSEVVAITVINNTNQPPVLDSIGPKIVYEGGVLIFQVHATDETGFPTLLVSATTMNNHYTFVDGGNGYGTFTYSPDYYDAGTDTVTFFALDSGGASDVERVIITTMDVNRPPHISRMTDYTILPGDSLKIRIIATDSTDANGGALYLISLAKPTGAVFTDSAGGKGSLRWKPTVADTGTHNFIVLCLDDESPALSDVDTARITVLKTNQAPVLATIGAKSVREGDTLRVHLSATDPDGTIPFFYAQGTPTNATLVDSTNGRGSFTFTPSFRQSGLYSVKFFASDGNKVDYEVVLIQVVNVAQPPILSVPADTQSVLEGDSLLFKISVTDADSTIDVITVDAATLPVNATFVDSLNGRGLFRFKPNYTQAGIYNVRFYATDGVAKDTAVVVVKCISAGNQRPKITVTPISVTATERDDITIRVTATDADGSYPVLSTSTPLPFTATFVDSGLGIGGLIWHTQNLQTGTYQIVFYATDSDTTGVVDSFTVPIVLNDLNYSPNQLLFKPFDICTMGLDCKQTVDEGATLQFKIYTVDPDQTHPLFRARRYAISGTDTTYSAIPANMALTDLRNDTANFVFTPDYTQSVGSPYNIMFTARDEVDTTVRVQIALKITVTNVSLPVVLDSIGSLSVLEGGVLDVVVTGRDPDGYAVVLSATGLPSGATFTSITGQPAGTSRSRFLYSPGLTAAGTYTTVFKVSETVGTTVDSEVVTITVIDAGNQRPVLAAIGAKSVTEGLTLNFNDSATDPDGTTPTMTAAYVPVNATFVDNGNGTGTFNFNPSFAQAGTYYVIFIASDGTLADSETVTITVIEAGNQRPVLAAIGAKSVTEGLTLNFNDSATDPDGTVPTMTAVNVPTNATFVNNGNRTGTFNFNPSFTQAGTYNVIFIASDGTLADSETVTITVIEAGNQRPVLAAIGAKSVTEGLTLNFNDSATDPDGTIPTMTAVNVPVNATFVNNGNRTGTFNFNPSFTQAGTYNVTFIASDGTLADSEVVTITVIEAGNQRPVLAAIGAKSVTEGKTLGFNDSATDPDGTIPTMTAVNLPVNATFVNNGNGTGTFSFSPDTLQAGVFSVTFIASDGALADSETVVITVVDINDQPPVLAAIGAKSVTEGLTLNFNDSATDPNGTIPTMTAANVPTNATFVNNGNGTGTFNFSPSFAQAGTYHITFIASDGALADSEVVTITVIEAGNQRPVLAAIGAKSVTEGLTLNFNDSATDPDGTVPTMTAVNVPTNATFVNNGNGTGTFNFHPSYTQASTYNVTFIASDGTLADSETVTITVIEAGNQRPVLATIGPRGVNEGANLNFVASATDPDGTIPTLTAVSVPTNATFVNNGNGTGTFNFNPSFTQAGVFSVTFIASDGTLADTEIVAITVVNVDRAPVLTALDTLKLVNATGEQAILWLRAVDPDGTTPTLSVIGTPIVPYNAVFIDSGNGRGSFIWDPTSAQGDSSYLLRFIASDGLLADTIAVRLRVVAAMRGDANNDGSIDVSDVVYLITYIFSGGPAPATIRNGNADGSDADGPNAVDVSDVVYLIAYIFSGGPVPPL